MVIGSVKFAPSLKVFYIPLGVAFILQRPPAFFTSQPLHHHSTPVLKSQLRQQLPH